ncbi:MAG: glycosyltransferase family 4 protein [Acidobacteria bacterium]|nr:glycosyltransferase family 4 protein [Acidobacteriota bacterium]
MPDSKPKVTFVVHRYGLDIGGGAEEYCRRVAERMCSHWDIEVVTTCARDYMTWANELSPGVERIHRVTVIRFPVEETRDMKLFQDQMDAVLKTSAIQEQEQWMRSQGPYSPSMFDYLQRIYPERDLFIFFSYLYAHTYFGLPLVAPKSALVPMAHDEAPIHLGIYRSIFGSARYLLFLSPEERKLVQSIFQLKEGTHDVVGIGWDALAVGRGVSGAEVQASETGRKGLDIKNLGPERSAFYSTGQPLVSVLQPTSLDSQLLTHNARHRGELLRPNPAPKVRKPYGLYIGRIDYAKGLGDLFHYFVHSPTSLNLVLIGEKHMDLPQDPRIQYLGFVSDQDKHALLEDAELLFLPSPYESLSLSLLEAWAAGIPVVANGKGAVLRGQCERGGGGFLYQTQEEFVCALDRLMESKARRVKMGLLGQRYVRKTYRWTEVEQHYFKVLAHVRELSQ